MLGDGLYKRFFATPYLGSYDYWSITPDITELNRLASFSDSLPIVRAINCASNVNSFHRITDEAVNPTASNSVIGTSNGHGLLPLLVIIANTQ
jgi:hypothetical protein